MKPISLMQKNINKYLKKGKLHLYGNFKIDDEIIIIEDAKMIKAGEFEGELFDMYEICGAFLNKSEDDIVLLESLSLEDEEVFNFRFFEDFDAWFEKSVKTINGNYEFYSNSR